MPLLDIRHLQTHFRTGNGVLRAVDDISFSIDPGETVAVVGESGSGKSVTSLSILGLLPKDRTRHSGSIRFEDHELLDFSEKQLRAIRGKDISMVFQEPMTSLNPVLTIGQQISETLLLHETISPDQARRKAIEMLRMVEISSPEKRIDEYPHQLSGGMRQRAMIGMALACSPKLLIADEPTTALDVTVQAQVLDLMKSLQKRVGTAILLITHDLGVVAGTADRVVVMYAGRTVETATTRELFAHPQHPYTKGLLATVPRIGSTLGFDRPPRLPDIPGQVPQLDHALGGCAFAPRCPVAMQRCRSEAPLLRQIASLRTVSCHLGEDAGQ
jgi:peptide/nickel transport system ATP-binding protein